MTTPRMVCPFFDLSSSKDVTEIAKGLTGEFMPAKGNDAYLIQQQMLRLSQNTHQTAT